MKSELNFKLPECFFLFKIPSFYFILTELSPRFQGCLHIKSLLSFYTIFFSFIHPHITQPFKGQTLNLKLMWVLQNSSVTRELFVRFTSVIYI